jgi:hypothetical protein
MMEDRHLEIKNLSNTTDAHSTRVEITSYADSVVVT